MKGGVSEGARWGGEDVYRIDGLLCNKDEVENGSIAERVRAGTFHVVFEVGSHRVAYVEYGFVCFFACGRAGIAFIVIIEGANEDPDDAWATANITR